MRFRVEHTFEGIEREAYETLYFDDAFNQALCDAVNLGRRVVDQSEREGVLHREVEVEARGREIPKPVAKVLGQDSITYTEILDYRLGSFEGTWRTVPGMMADKIKSGGRFGFDRSPSGGVTRWVDGEVVVKVFGIGAVVERFVRMDIEKSYDNAASFTRSYIQNMKL